MDRKAMYRLSYGLFVLTAREAECIENCDCIDGYIKILSLPDEYKRKAEFKEICKKCKYHID